MGLLDGLLNIAGLLLSLFGVVFLFLYGLPYRCTAPGSLDDRLSYAARLKVCSCQAARMSAGLRCRFFSISHSAL
jgi:hypothetical protein